MIYFFRCIYIDSVDSGRSSDTGTHQSWTSSTGSSTKSSTKSASDSGVAGASGAPGAIAGAASVTGPGGNNNPNNVQIVPHTFCDYLGSIKRRISPSSTGWVLYFYSIILLKSFFIAVARSSWTMSDMVKYKGSEL